MNIGKGIKFVRIASGLRQGEMAERLGISQNYLSLLENNKAEPSIALLKKISKNFGVPAGFLFWEDAMPSEGEKPEVTEKYERIRSLVHELQQLRISHQLQSATE
ncbi:MAG: helix-turn-helix transcriptional regulator [Phycisphaerae bacterium]|nr:helix-turn-helix transcriptional regulator [Phycisphaerae bacterium]MDD5381947.1 helix-turn-helix transcriptional regulator [Phycisphaerae bacterium]